MKHYLIPFVGKLFIASLSIGFISCELIDISGPPEISCASNRHEVSVEDPINFSSEAKSYLGEPINNIRWDFGDSNSSLQQNPTHSYQLAGIYTATATARDSKGKVSQCSKIITVRNKEFPREEEKENESTENDDEYSNCLTNETLAVGGNGGSPFYTNTIPTEGSVLSVQVRAGSRIDAIIIKYKDKSGNFHEIREGGNGGDLKPTHNLPQGVYIIGIEGRAGSRLDRIRFLFSDGSRTPFYGGNGGNEFNITLGSNQRFIGIHGRSGSEIDKIGLVYCEKRN